jgi:hypothetical membrane protein
MKKKTEILLLAGSCFLMLMAMFILPVWMVPGHSIVRNTLSELGAQSSPYAWILNVLLAAWAICSFIAGWKCFGGFLFQQIILSFFSISLLLAAFFNQAPVSPGESFSLIEAGWHSYLMGTSWLSFIILTFSTALLAENPLIRYWSVIAGLCAVSLWLLGKEADQAAGIWQRLQFILSFAWMVFIFKMSDLLEIQQ